MTGPDKAVPDSSARDIDELIGRMTLDEKAALTAGVDAWHTFAIERLGIPPVRLTDGPNGARGATGPDYLSVTPSVCIPSASALGATWDPDVVSAASAAVARQARDKSARVLLAPTVNLHRHPLWGRNFECFSEDPFLSGKLAVAFISGVQAQGVIATVKHLVCNETEFERRTSSSEVDERTLRELYLLPFEMAVREGDVLALMTSYNRVNGRYVPDNERFLSEILRGEWGFRGLVMTDWSAGVTTIEAARGGLDLEMPGPARAFGPALARAVREGEVDEAHLDDKVRRLLRTFDEIGALADPVDKSEAPLDRPEDRAAARRAASEAIVLLTNDGVLPLSGLAKVAVIGPNAELPAVMGGGSARVKPHYSVSPLEALRQRLGFGTEVVFEAGCALATSAAEAGATASAGAGASEHAIARAVEAARQADVAIVVVGTNDYWESEGVDRETMDLPGAQSELVERVIAANPRSVVVVNSGAPVSLPFADDAAALVQCWFGGQELGNALADVLVGDADPAGRLPVTLPERIEHTPAFGNFPGESGQVRYGEGLLMGYRWYEARHLPVRFPFGHGLSYTSFQIKAVRTSASRLVRDGVLSVDVDVVNTGKRPGSEVVQLYVAPPGGGTAPPGGRLRPAKQLKGFAKVRLGPGEATTVRLELSARSFAYYDVEDAAWPVLLSRLGGPHHDPETGALHRSKAGWYVDPGTYQLHVGRSSADIAHIVEVDVEGGPEPLPATERPG
jgi:beta-glucosidase